MSYAVAGGCVCGAIFAPVCGVDGNQYGNKCSAGCAGVAVDCESPCPCERKFCGGTSVNIRISFQIFVITCSELGF